jgi:WhiB family redox-sensing transcriptional regulator
MTIWQNAAACLGEDVALFFPAGHGGEFTVQINKAKAICRGCPVREACLRDALHRPERYGIWGGLTEHELAALRRNDRRRRHPQYSAKESA